MKKSYIPIIVITVAVIILISLGVYYVTIGPKDTNTIKVENTIESVEPTKPEKVQPDVIEYNGEKYYKLERQYSLDNGHMTNEELAKVYLEQISFNCEVDTQVIDSSINGNEADIEQNQLITLNFNYTNPEVGDFLEVIKLINNETGEVISESTMLDRNSTVFECKSTIPIEKLSIQYGSNNLDYYMTTHLSDIIK